MPELEPVRPEFLPEDLTRLEQEVKERQLRPEHAAAPSREIIRESIRSSFSPPAAAPAPDHLPDYLSAAAPHHRAAVDRLVDLALSRGIAKAAAAARAASPFILDAFHDALVDKIYPELVRRGVIKE